MRRALRGPPGRGPGEEVTGTEVGCGDRKAGEDAEETHRLSGEGAEAGAALKGAHVG